MASFKIFGKGRQESKKASVETGIHSKKLKKPSNLPYFIIVFNNL
jgi:hypothetical protein